MTDYKMTADSGSYGISGEDVELWVYGTYAPAWFADARKEAAIEDAHARRREIIFAVCAVESYLVEWVRNDVLKADFRSRRLDHYFPRGTKAKGIVERWKHVINHLNEDGTISGKPDWGQTFWKQFNDLVDFRNGILHGRTSRPDQGGLSLEERPEPRVQQLAKLGPGGAVKVAAEVIKNLHEAVGTPSPEWLG